MVQIDRRSGQEFRAVDHRLLDALVELEDLRQLHLLVLRVRQGWDEHEIVVSAVTDQRRGAPIAQTLYEETPQSVMRRARAAEARKAAGAMRKPTQKPGKHERKALQRLRKQFDPS